MRKKVLVIDNSLGVTGAFKAIQAMALSLRAEFEFHFAVPVESSVAGLLRDQHFEVLRVPFLEIRKNWHSLLYPIRLWMNARSIVRHCVEHSIGIIHVNDLYNMAGVACRVLDPSLRLVQHVRLLPDSYARPLYGFWLNRAASRADRVVAVSEVVKKSVLSRIPASRLTRIYDFFPLPETEQRKHPGAIVSFLYLANFTPGKGQDHALQAFRGLYKANPAVRLLLAGSDFGVPANVAYRRQLEDFIRLHHLEEFVECRVSGQNVEHLIKTHDVLLNFSDSESFSMVCYEGLYYGTPVISTDCGGPAELIAHQKNGLLVPVGNVEAMASAMMELANDADLRFNLAQRGYEEIHQRVHAEDSPGQFRKLYESLLQG